MTGDGRGRPARSCAAARRAASGCSSAVPRRPVAGSPWPSRSVGRLAAATWVEVCQCRHAGPRTGLRDNALGRGQQKTTGLMDGGCLSAGRPRGKPPGDGRIVARNTHPVSTSAPCRFDPFRVPRSGDWSRRSARRSRKRLDDAPDGSSRATGRRRRSPPPGSGGRGRSVRRFRRRRDKLVRFPHNRPRQQWRSGVPADDAPDRDVRSRRRPARSAPRPRTRRCWSARCSRSNGSSSARTG